MKKAEEWLSLLYAYGESQLSRSLFGTESDLIKQLPLEMIIKTSLIEEENIYRGRKYKTKFFDPQKKIIYDQVVKVCKQKGISLWKPVWEFLLQQVPETYVFFGESLFTEFVPLDIKYGSKDDFTFEPYLACSIPNNSKLFRKTASLQEQRERKIDSLQKNLSFSVIIALVGFLISSFFDRWISGGIFLILIGVIVSIFYSKSNLVKKFIILTRKEILKELFPEKKTFKDLIISNHLTVRINLFQNEQLGVKRFENYSKDEKITPSYAQHTDYISVSIKKEEEIRFNQLVEKKTTNDPIMYFEMDEVVVIPFEGLDDHPVMQYIMENIKIDSLDIPEIIDSYLKKTLQIEINDV